MIAIYKITSPTNKVYIGQSWNIEERFKSYRKLSKRNSGQVALYNSLLKHGVNFHNYEIIHEFPEDITQLVLDTYEQLYMDKYRECNIELLNIREAGSRGKHSEETKQKIREKRKLQVFSEEDKRRMSESRRGKKRGTNPKMVGKNNHFYGKRHSEETKIRISESREIPILQLSKNGEFIKEWTSAQRAAKDLGMSQSGISACCHNYRNQKFHRGFMWKFKITDSTKMAQ